MNRKTITQIIIILLITITLLFVFLTQPATPTASYNATAIHADHLLNIQLTAQVKP